MWGVCAVFTLGSFWLYAVTPGQGAPSPLRGILRRVDAAFFDLEALVRRMGGWLGTRS
jgi:hypothetical protein